MSNEDNGAVVTGLKGDRKTPGELVDDVANISDEIVNQFPHWRRVLRDLCVVPPGAGKLNIIITNEKATPNASQGICLVLRFFSTFLDATNHNGIMIM